MGKRALDVLTGLVVLVAVGISSYLLYSRFGPTNTSSDTTAPTPARRAGTDELPHLEAAQIAELLPDVEALPPALQDGATTRSYTHNLDDDQHTRDRAASALAERLATLRNTYEWHSATGVEFNTCASHADVGSIAVELSQLPSAQLARNFIDDPAVRGYYRAQGFVVSTVEDVHGWALTSGEPKTGICYAQEYDVQLFFDHRGLLFRLQATANAADPAAARKALETLLPELVGRVDALDVFTQEPSPTPTPQPVARLLTDAVTLDGLDLYLPSVRDWDLSASYFTTHDESRRFELNELVAFYRDLGITTLADAIDRAGRRYGLIGQEVRVWKPDEDCPAAPNPVRLEVDLALFERPAGAEAYMQDPTVQAAWQSTGLLTEFENEMGTVYAFGQVGHACGTMQIVQKSIPFERLLLTLSVALPASLPRADAVAQVDAMLRTAVVTLYAERLQ